MKKIYLILTICLLFLSINVYAKPAKSTSTSKTVTTSTTLVASDKRHILLDVNTGIKVITMSDVGSTLKVTELDPTSEEYERLSIDNSNTINAYDISIVGGYKGKTTVEVNVDKSLTGREVIISYIKDNKLKKINTVAYDGKVSFDIDELTKIMLSYSDYETLTGKKLTVFKSNKLLFYITAAAVVIVTGILIYMYIKKRNSL
jgi:hypothetical protein